MEPTHKHFAAGKARGNQHREEQDSSHNHRPSHSPARNAPWPSAQAPRPASRTIPVELRLAHWVPPTHPIQVHAWEQWAQSIIRGVGRPITVTLYPALASSATNDHYDMARDGISDIAFCEPWLLSQAASPVIAAGRIAVHGVQSAKGGSAATVPGTGNMPNRRCRTSSSA